MTPPAGWRPRLVALDIDGTLCVADDGVAPHGIRPAVLEAVAAAMRDGAHIVLCTGRNMLAVAPLPGALGLPDGMAICSNGAVWVDVASFRITRQRVFHPAEPGHRLRALFPGAVFSAEEVGVGVRITAGYRSEPSEGRTRVVDFAELVATPTPRLTVWWPDRTAAEMASVLASVLIPGVQYSLDHTDAWLWATPAGVTKASALEELRTRLGVAANETLAIGDGTNDVEMLAWAAHGVAMGQAPEAVRAVADEITADVHADGAALALRRWFR